MCLTESLYFFINDSSNKDNDSSNNGNDSSNNDNNSSNNDNDSSNNDNQIVVRVSDLNVWTFWTLMETMIVVMTLWYTIMQRPKNGYYYLIMS